MENFVVSPLLAPSRHVRKLVLLLPHMEEVLQIDAEEEIMWKACEEQSSLTMTCILEQMWYLT